MDPMAFSLPGGYVDDRDRVHDQVILRPLCGVSEKIVATGNDTSRPVLVTTLLCHCLEQVGDLEPVNVGLVRRLLVGDRNFLLLKLHEMTFGRQIRAVITCAFPDCGSQIDIDFHAGDIPIDTAPQTSRKYRLQLSPAAGGHQVAFRLPNGGDQEALAPLLEHDEEKAADKLLARCITAIYGGTFGGRTDIAALPPAAKKEIEEEMERLAPAVGTSFEARCPDCGRSFTAAFDVQEFVLTRLATRLDLLLQEVHYLAYHYHWSEREILGLTREDRRRYIEVLSTEIERLNYAW